MSLLTSAIPLPYRILGIVVIVTLLVGGSSFWGYTKGKASADKIIAEYAAKVEKLSSNINEVQVKIVDRIVTKFVDRVRVIHDKGVHNENIAITKVPDVVKLSAGWVYTHDAAAGNQNADAARSADASPSGVAANQALGTVVQNYGTCEETRQQLIGLQSWVIETKQNIDEQNAKIKKRK
jgi:hypothetical protein